MWKIAQNRLFNHSGVKMTADQPETWHYDFLSYFTSDEQKKNSENSNPYDFYLKSSVPTTLTQKTQNSQGCQLREKLQSSH